MGGDFIKKKRLILLLPFLLLTSCNGIDTSVSDSEKPTTSSETTISTTLPDSTTFSLDTSETTSETSETTSETSETTSETTSIDPDPIEDYKELKNGLYVNYLPGFYDESFELKFKVADESKYEILYSLNYDEPVNEYVSPLKIKELNNEGISHYPLTTGVDGILPYLSVGRCVSLAYVNNIQKARNYPKFPKQNVVTVSLVEKSTGNKVFTQSLTYVVKENAKTFFKIPVVSLSMPQQDWMAGRDGMYNNIDQEIEKRVRMEYLDPVNDDYYYANSKIKLGGNFSLGYPQRTLNLNFAKDENGNKNDAMKCDLFRGATKDGFKDEKLTKFKRFRLHNGGNCFEESTTINDAVLQSLMTGTNATTTSYRPCIAYLNGEYWGIYSIREHYSDVMIEQNYNVNKDDVIICEYNGSYYVDDGDVDSGNKAIEELMVAQGKDLSVKENYEDLITNYIDEDSLIDLFIAESYGANWDFVGNNNNLKMWRTSKIDPENPYADGRWRFGLHDTDFTLQVQTNFLDKNQEFSYQKMQLFGNLCKNETFVNKFYNRANDLLKTNLSYANEAKVFSSLITTIKEYRLDSFIRWGQKEEYMDTWENSIRDTLTWFNTRNNKYISDLKKTFNI